MSKHYTPLEVSEALVAPIGELAALAGLNPKAPYTWRKPSSWRSAGDMPPNANRAILNHSRTHGLGLTADHLIFGASAAEVDAILAARESEAA